MSPEPFPELPIIGPDDDHDDADETPRTVLITGAAGNIGGKLRAAWDGVYDLVLIDRDDAGDPDVIAADLADPDAGWADHFEGVDTVIHLAANPSESATWEELIGPNLDALANVFHAAALAGVDRVIFASSNHAMGDYMDRPDTPITVELPPLPDGPYGAAKLMGERLGKSLAAQFDLSFIALRLGWVQRGANRPATLPDDWSRKLWLSDADCIRLFTAAVEAELEPGDFVVVNGMSANRGTRWSLAEAAAALGFVPEDDSAAG